MTYKQFGGLYINPRTIHIANAGASADTGMLRVRGSLTGLPEDDTLVEFAREEKLDSYPSLPDSTIAIGGTGLIPKPDSCFAASGPYPDPSVTSANDVSVLVHYCSTGTTISVAVYNSLGVQVGSTSTMTSDGQVWDRLSVPAPSTAGSYYIHVTVGVYSTVLNYSVS